MIDEEGEIGVVDGLVLVAGREADERDDVTFRVGGQAHDVADPLARQEMRLAHDLAEAALVEVHGSAFDRHQRSEVVVEPLGAFPQSRAGALDGVEQDR